MKLSDLGEFGLIARLARGASAGEGVICGIGDDCAVIESGKPGLALLVTTDLLVEGVHFDRRTTTARWLGRKTLAASLSDVAAMGGEPRAFTVNLAAPPALTVDWVDALYAGIDERARASRAALVGGDTSSSPGPIFLSMTLLGRCPAEEVVYRRGARAGDAIFLTGWPGESAAGLALLGAGAAGREPPGLISAEETAQRERLQARHLDPEPRLSAGRRIAAGRLATAMIDVSDGVVADLGHILESSGAGARVDAAAVPLSRDLVNTCRLLGLDPLRLALTGGEDYELLFTGPPSPGAAELSGVLGLPVSRIGTITPAAGRLEILDPEGRALDLPRGGFEHFHP
jgi:thiamine-monophosphate kinase